MKRSYQPSGIKRKRSHGFRKRSLTQSGKKLLARRRRKKGKAWWFLLEKNKVLIALNKKSDFDFLKQKAPVFSYQWLKVFFLYKKGDKNISLAWSLPKSYISQAVLRNRLKRWGRATLRKNRFRGYLFIIF